MTLRKSDLAAWLTDHGLVVEGTETRDELDEAYRHYREHLGDPLPKPARTEPTAA